jgi:hypothetical protein
MIKSNACELMVTFLSLIPKGRAGCNDADLTIKSLELIESSNLLLTSSPGKSRYRNIMVINIP